jgi:adenylate kinase family enzyme
MRIGISGAAGTGKTTLAQNLAAKLGLPLIPDFVEEVLREHGKDSWRGINDTRIRHTIRMTALERKIAAEREAEAFVSDKTVVDYLAYWLLNQMEFETKEQNAAVVELVRPHVARYTHRLVLPYRAEVDFATGRNQDPVHNLKVAGLKRGLWTELGAPAIETPYGFADDLDAWIARWLAPPAAAGEGAARPKKAGAKRKKGG